MIVQEHAGLFEHVLLPSGSETMKPEKIAPSNVKKVRDTLKSAVREWSKYGEPEREQPYKPILEEVESYCKELGVKPLNTPTGKRVSVLNPGCGMGRLVYEFARRGFKTQGNEFTYFMLLASQYILNQAKSAESFLIFPFIHNFHNLKSVEAAF